MDFNNKESIRQFALEDFQNRFSDTYEGNKKQINNFFNSYFGAKKSAGINVKEHLAPAGLASNSGIQRLNNLLHESVSGVSPGSKDLLQRIVSPLEAARSTRNGTNAPFRTISDYSSNYGTLAVSEGSGSLSFNTSENLNIITNGRYSHSNFNYNSSNSSSPLNEQTVNEDIVINNRISQSMQVNGLNSDEIRYNDWLEKNARPVETSVDNFQLEIGKNININPAKSSGAYSQNSNNTIGTYTGNTITSSQKTSPFREPVTYTDLNTESTGNSVYAQNGAAASVNRTPPATGAPRGSSLSNNTTPQIDIDESPGTFKDKLKQHWNDYKEYRADQEVDFISSKRMDQVGPGKEFETEGDLRGHIKNTFMSSSSVDEAERLLDKESMDRVRGEYPGWLETSPKQRLVSKTAIQREKEPISKEGSLLDRVLRRNVDPSDKKRTITDKLMGRGGPAEPVQDLRGSHEYITEQYDNGNPYLTDKNARFLDRKGVRMSVEQAANEAAKDQGTGLGKFSSQTGWDHSVAQARAASVGERTNAFLNSANILGGSSRESLLNSIGMLTADQKVKIAKEGGLSKIFTQGSVALGGVFTAGYALQSEDVGNEMIASTAASWGIMQGWRAGRDFGSILRASHVTRVGFGAVGAASTAALGYGAIKAFSDLTSNESFIVDAAKNFASKEIFSKNQESDLALTLRQRSMQKLASSALNNRGQLLGNEAQVLKGVGIHG